MFIYLRFQILIEINRFPLALNVNILLKEVEDMNLKKYLDTVLIIFTSFQRNQQLNF